MRLEPITEAGAALIAEIDALAPTLEQYVAAADTEGEMSPQAVQALRKTKIPAAFVPIELGGLGLESIHDWLVAIARLAASDASLAIAINMHMGVTRGMAQGYRFAGAAGGALEAVVGGHMLVCATATERGTDNLHPLTEAVLDADEYVINGTKMFVTGSPWSTHLGMNLRVRGNDTDEIATTLLPIRTDGVIPNDDWNALGMRASGSQSIRFEGVRIAKASLRVLGPWGRWSATTLTNRAVGNLPLLGAFVGIGEAACEFALNSAAGQERVGTKVRDLPGAHQLAGEMVTALETARGAVVRAAQFADHVLANAGPSGLDEATAYALMQRYQLAKSVSNGAAIKVVNLAMDLVGGASFSASNPLARMYRDVRAGPFMQPGAPLDATQFVGQVALGVPPEA